MAHDSGFTQWAEANQQQALLVDVYSRMHPELKLEVEVEVEASDHRDFSYGPKGNFSDAAAQD
jgi:hypothetical protein